jgi:hypothetical protein
MHKLELFSRAQGRCIPELEWNAPAHSLFHAALGMHRRAQGLFNAALGMYLPALAPMAAMQRRLIWRQVLVSMGLWRMEHKPQPRLRRRGRR